MRIILGLCALSLVVGCTSTSRIQDKGFDEVNHARSAMLSTVDTPTALITSTWASPYKKEADDLVPTDAVPVGLGMVTDPWNTLPPPLGTAYYPWKAFVTVVRAIPLVGYPTGDDNCKVWGGDDGGPLWYVIAPGINAVDALVSPIGEDVTPAHTPVPGNGKFFAYWQARNSAMRKGMVHAGNTMKYLLLNSNSSQWPYDSWSPTQLTRSKTTMHNTFDLHLFNFDWDDPFAN